MLTRIIVIALIGGLVYLNYSNPTEQEHKDAIIAELQQSWPIPEEIQAQIWSKVDYTNFLVQLPSTKLQTPFIKTIKIVNDKWVEETRRNVSRQLEL